MADDPTERPLSDRELAQLLHAAAEDLVDRDRAREGVLVDLLQLVSRETPNVELRVDTIGSRGRVSFGRGNAGEYGTAVFIPEEVANPDEIEDVAGEEEAEV